MKGGVYGRLGEGLRLLLSKEDIAAFSSCKSLVDEVAFLARLEKERPMSAGALSLLHATFPKQVSGISPMSLADLALCEIKGIEGFRVSELRHGAVNKYLRYVDGAHRSNFPFKLEADEGKRQNVRLCELLDDLRSLDKSCYIVIMRAIGHLVVHKEFYDDQLAGFVLYSYGLYRNVGVEAIAIGARIIADPEGAKILNVAIKSLGLNSTRLGALLCETNTLQGRAVGAVDLEAEAVYRCDTEALAGNFPKIGDDELRKRVRAILLREINPEKLSFEDTEVMWSKRWLWCANGSHNRLLERVEPQYSVGEGLPKRIHRRVFAERCKVNPLETWSGKSYFTASEKLEHGKRRAIFSSDSATYINFEHILRPVELAWRNKIAILDPGRLGAVGTSVMLSSRKGTHVMLDYDDFNSQHSLRAQQILFEELIEVCGYDPERGRLLVDSFRKSEVYVRGKYVGRLQGTLMSGHRATTFINTVLNEAYVTIAAPRSIPWFRMHVGDDVYVNSPTLVGGAALLKECSEAGLRMNRTKQSFGRHCREFLRVAVGGRDAFGYFARSVSSTVSGVWEKEKRSGSARLKNFVSLAWTLRARSGVDDVGLLLRKAACAKTRLRGGVIRNLLTHKVACGEGAPIWGRSLEYRYYTLSETEVDSLLSEMAVGARSVRGATTDYLTEHTTLVERAILIDLQRSLLNEMVDSSYGKTLPYIEGEKVVERAELHGPSTFVTRVPLLRAVRYQGQEGVLNKYPLLVLMKDRMPRRLVRKAVRLAGHEPSGDIMVQAWGESSSYSGSDSVLPYNEISSLAGKYGGAYIFANRDVSF